MNTYKHTHIASIAHALCNFDQAGKKVLHIGCMYVKTGKSWGSIPDKVKAHWKELECDDVFGVREWEGETSFSVFER